MKDIKELIESSKSVAEILKVLSESSKPAVIYIQEVDEDGEVRKSKDTWSKEQVQDMLDNWKLYREAGNLPKYLLIAYMEKFNLRNFKDEPIKEILKKAVSNPIKIEIKKEYRTRFGTPIFTKVSFKVNGKEITK